MDGNTHLTAKIIKEAIKHDERRDAFVLSKGSKVLRFAARDVMYRQDLVKERLKRI